MRDTHAELSRAEQALYAEMPKWVAPACAISVFAGVPGAVALLGYARLVKARGWLR